MPEIPKDTPKAAKIQKMATPNHKKTRISKEGNSKTHQKHRFQNKATLRHTRKARNIKRRQLQDTKICNFF